MTWRHTWMNRFLASTTVFGEFRFQRLWRICFVLTGVSTYVFGDLICCVIFAVVRPNIGCGAGSLFFVCVWFGFVLVVFVLLFGVVCLVEYFGLTIQRPGFLNSLPIMATTLTATIVMMSAAWPKKKRDTNISRKSTVEMTPRRILHKKTQLPPPRSAGETRTFHINLQSKWRPRAFYMRKRNDFSGVGGGLRGGCKIRNRGGWDVSGRCTCTHLDATQHDVSCTGTHVGATHPSPIKIRIHRWLLHQTKLFFIKTKKQNFGRFWQTHCI